MKVVEGTLWVDFHCVPSKTFGSQWPLSRKHAGRMVDCDFDSLGQVTSFLHVPHVGFFLVVLLFPARA